MTKKRLKAKLADQKRISGVMSTTIQGYHARVDELRNEVQRVKARSFDLIERREG